MRCVLLAGLRGSRTIGNHLFMAKTHGRPTTGPAKGYCTPSLIQVQTTLRKRGMVCMGMTPSEGHMAIHSDDENFWPRLAAARGACAARQHCRPWRNHRGPVGSPPGRELARYSTLHFGPLLLGKADPGFSHFK